MMKKKMMAAFVLTGALVFGSSMQASACMGIYVGKDVSETGSSYIGRSEDLEEGHTKIFTVHPAEDHAPGSMYTDAYGFSMPYPSHTYRYTLAKDSPNFGEGEEAYAEVGINENEVAMTATVSTAYNDRAKNADPLVSTGICEISIGSILLGQAETARHGVELLGKIVDQYGSGECNTIMISDPNETWYMEIVSGHQYAAVKLPDDQVAAIPNMMLLGTVDVTDTENVIASEGLVSLAEEHGFLKTQNGLIHVAQTYGRENPGKGQLSRLWQGTYYLNAAKGEAMSIEPSQDGTYGPYDLLFSPDKKLTSQDIMKFLAYRGEGTKMDSNADASIYPIGNSNQAECHILEMRDGMYEGMSGVQWLAMSRAEFSLYLPYYGAMLTETWEGYHKEEISTVPDSIFWVFEDLNQLADDNRELYGTNIRKYWDQYQAALIEQQKQVDVDMQTLYEKNPALAQEKATELGKVIAQDAFQSAKTMLSELRTFVANGTSGQFIPSVLTNHVMPDYTVERVMDAVSTEQLESLIKEVQTLVKEAYTEVSYGALQTSLEQANTVLADPFALQSEIDAVAAQLEQAIQGLEKVENPSKEQPEKGQQDGTQTGQNPKEPSKPAAAPTAHTKAKAQTVKTGDVSPVMLLLLTAVVSGATGATIWKRKM